MPFVVDASMALAWHFEDEQTDYTATVLRRLRDDRALAPTLWVLEMANGFIVAERRGRISPAEVASAVQRTLMLPIDLQEVPLALALGHVSLLAKEHRLTIYNAAYLELAMREGLPIATQDSDLIAAARRVGLPRLE